MANSIAYPKNYTAVLDEVYKRAACSTCLNSPRRMARAGRNAKEIMVPKIEVIGLGDYTRNVGYKAGSITYEFETKTFNCDRGIKLLADVMDLDGAVAPQAPSSPLIRPRPAHLPIIRLRRPRLAVILVRGVDEAFHVLEVFIVVAPT